MLNQSRNSSESTFRPTVEALEDRLVPSGYDLKAMMPSPVVGLTLETGLGQGIAVVERDLGASVAPLVRLRRVVGEAVPTPATNTSLAFVKIDFLRTIDGGTSPVTMLFLKTDKGVLA
jgi:hypothetical protein